MKIKVGLYGMNGHQIQSLLIDNPAAELVAAAAFDKSRLLPEQRENRGIRIYDSLDKLIQDKEVQFISICSPSRRNQTEEVIRCLNAGKHVYAEKPCATEEADLDKIIEVSRRTGYRFHEMAGTAFEQPYLAMRNIVNQGLIGTVVQIFAQKSYPYHAQRPQEKNMDRGLICQNGVHAFRFIEHVGCQKIRDIYAVETSLGNPVSPGGLQKMAASCMMTLENGGVASVICNYLNQKGFGLWGNEHLRIFGTKGFIESVDGGQKRDWLLVTGITVKLIERSPG